VSGSNVDPVENQSQRLFRCMKDGCLVETGTHEELMKIPDGAYFKLYDIQSKAFESDAEARSDAGSNRA
jgi:hypothetical protein